MNQSSFGYLNSLKCDARAYLNRASNRLNTVIVSCLTLISAPHLSQAADIAYTGTGTDDQWSNTANWHNTTIPNDSSTGAAFWNNDTHVIIDANTDAICNGFMLGMYGADTSAEIAGTVTCNWLNVGRANQNGGSGTLELSGGTVTVSGTLTIPTQFGSQSDPNNLGSGHIDLLSGTLTAGSLHIGNGQTGHNGGNGSIYVTEGSLIINGDVTATLQTSIDSGNITTAADRTLKLDYNVSTSGKTTLASIPTPTPTNVDHPYSGAGSDDLWSNASNWENGLVPDHSSNGAAFWHEGSHVLINSVATCRGFMLGMYGNTNTAEINGGKLTAEWADIGRCDHNGGDATLTITDGDVSVNGWLNIPTQFGSHTDPNNLGSGHIDLLKGTLTANAIHMGNGQVGHNGGNGSIYITEGTLIINGDSTSQIQDYIDAAYITTDSSRALALDYDLINNGQTTLRSLQADIDYAYTQAGGDTLWSNPSNWQQLASPSTSNTGAAFWNDGTHVTIDANTDAVCRGFMLGMYGNTTSAEINGGSLSAQWIDVGRCNENGGNGTLTLTSGTINVSGSLSIPTQFGTQPDINQIGSGHMDLLGGTLTAGSIHMGNGQIGNNGGNGSIFITNGILIVNGDQTNLIQSYIDAGYITTAAINDYSLDYDSSNAGQTTLSTFENFDAVASAPTPSDATTDFYGLDALSWQPALGATEYRVYFGNTTTPELFATLDSDQTSFSASPLEHNTTYYWRVDAVRGGIVNAGPLWSFTTEAEPAYTAVTPPWTNYCEEMAQEIQGKKHGFLAGNKTYYIGGFHGSWHIYEEETIGFTHPFHNDLRSRGYGMVEDETTGYGHDFSGWEFYKETKVAYGTVIINGTRYETPVPTAMYWRPDRMICEYVVGGVNIREEKYIGLNDAACAIITSDAPVTLEFAGQSFYKDGITQSTTATCNFDAANNAVHVVDGGINLVIPSNDPVNSQSPEDDQVPGVMMYDGMSTILTASKPLENYTNTTEATGQQKYSFSVPCDTSGVSLIWAMHDDGATTIAEAQAILEDPQTEMQAKTDYMNDLLNNQIPYFRCSDQEIVDVYYFLWSLYLMYYIDLSEGSEEYYAHTQTAVNNFLGMHRYDAAMQIPVSSWIADKAHYAFGNVLVWKSLLPYADLDNGIIPADNLGKTWYSGLWGGTTSHVEGAWKIYQHSGDIDFLTEAYDFYRTLMWNNMPGFWGQEFNAAKTLGLMALELGYPQSEADHWKTRVHSDFDSMFDYGWNNNGVENYFGYGSDVGWTTFGYLIMDDFPKDLARDMVETWAINDVNGFLTEEGLLAVAARPHWPDLPLTAFFVTPDTNYFMFKGMYSKNVDDHANDLALAHLKRYNYKDGIPYAPEAINTDHGWFGDQYSNFNAGKILTILEGICGLSYSVVDSSFTVADNLPKQWDYMEVYVPIEDNSNATNWTRVTVDRSEDQGVVTKNIQVQNNTQLLLNLEPWLEGKGVLSAPTGNIEDNDAPGHMSYQLWGKGDKSIQLQLSE